MDSPAIGVVNSWHPVDGGWRQVTLMEPISTAIVIVALVALAC